VVPECNLVIEIVQIRGASVRVGVSAPAAVGIYRAEYWVRLCRPGTEANPPPN